MSGIQTVGDLELHREYQRCLPAYIICNFCQGFVKVSVQIVWAGKHLYGQEEEKQKITIWIDPQRHILFFNELLCMSLVLDLCKNYKFVLCLIIRKAFFPFSHQDKAPCFIFISLIFPLETICLPSAFALLPLRVQGSSQVRFYLLEGIEFHATSALIL